MFAHRSARRTWISLVKPFVVVPLAITMIIQSAVAQEESTAETADEAIESVPFIKLGGLIDFGRDVQPILAEKCLRCHGPDEAKSGFRVDEEDTFLGYVEPEDLESSSLWVDYLVTDDEDMRMPPLSGKPEEALTGIELATIKLWIEEGAKWTEAPAPQAETHVSPLPDSQAARYWIFQGLFHPAMVHFPIALLTVSAGFVLLSFLRKKTCEPVAFHCLWIGCLGAMAASASGWSYAAHEGYGQGYSFDLQNSAIDRHRWLGIGVAVVSLILIPLAMSVKRTGDRGMRVMWLLGSLVLVGAVSTTGYQGGELTYGEGHYEQEYRRLFPAAEADPEYELTTEEVTEIAVEDAVEARSEDDDSASDAAASEPSPEMQAEDEDEGSATEAATTTADSSSAEAVDAEVGEVDAREEDQAAEAVIESDPEKST